MNNISVATYSRYCTSRQIWVFPRLSPWDQNDNEVAYKLAFSDYLLRFETTTEPCILQPVYISYVFYMPHSLVYFIVVFIVIAIISR